jgi:Ca-activated chloride channel family protein
MKFTPASSRASSALFIGMVLLAGCSEPVRKDKVDASAELVRPVVADARDKEVLPSPPPAPVSAPPPMQAPAPVTAPLAEAYVSNSAPVDIVVQQALARSRVYSYNGASNYAPPPPPVYSNDKYPDQDANSLTLVSDQPVSTFSVDVDTASYAMVRHALTSGALPPPGAVRVEEMVNYFPYKYATPPTRSQPFGVMTELMPSPWNPGNQLVHIAVRGYDIASVDRPRANVVLLVDVSGSMGPVDRLPLLKKGFRLFASQLRDDDQVAIVSYADGTRIVLEPTTGKDKHKIIAAIDALGAGGGTNGGDGLQRAYEMAERHFDPKAVNRIILATDGDFNLGISDPKQLEKFVADKRKTGVYLSIFGVGSGNLNDALIQRLTQSGNGNAAYIDSLLEARKAMSEELGSTMFPIANDVKVQVEFNPKLVSAYRLVGYETRMLKRQDFKDDKVDAGDMGAGHSVTAIYEITPASAAGKLVDPLRYGKEKAAAANGKGDSDEVCFIKLRYKLPGESVSKLTEHVVHARAARQSMQDVPDEQRFAVAVAAFAQRLRGEQQVSDYSYAEIATLANGARGKDNEGYRSEFVNLVRLADTLTKTGSTAQR